MTDRAAYPAVVTVVSRRAAQGRHEPGSQYAMTCWLGVLGPTATLAWTMLARYARVGGGPVDVDDLAGTLGVGHHSGSNSPISRTLTRMCQFRVSTYDQASVTLQVSAALPDVPERFVERMSRTALACHRIHVPPPPPVEDTMLARSLEVGL